MTGPLRVGDTQRSRGAVSAGERLFVMKHSVDLVGRDPWYLRLRVEVFKQALETQGGTLLSVEDVPRQGGARARVHYLLDTAAHRRSS